MKELKNIASSSSATNVAVWIMLAMYTEKTHPLLSTLAYTYIAVCAVSAIADALLFVYWLATKK